MKLSVLFTLIVTSVASADAMQCKELSASEVSQVLTREKKAGKSKIVWFASWCGSCANKIKAMTAAELGQSVFVGVFEEPAKSQRALEFLLKNHANQAAQSSKHFTPSCFSDRSGRIAKIFKVSSLPASTQI